MTTIRATNLALLGLLSNLAACAADRQAPAVYTFDVPDAMPRRSSDTLGRLEFVLSTAETPMCYGCRIWVSRPDAPSREFPSASGTRMTTGMLGTLPTGRYEVHVEGPEIMPLVHTVDVYNRRTVRADIHLVPRPVQ